MSVKITVLKRIANRDLAEKYCEPGVTVPCPRFTEGQEFIIQGNSRPEDFCSAAWHNIHKSYQVIRCGGKFAGWMKHDDTVIVCCKDGIRPVVFEISRIDT